MTNRRQFIKCGLSFTALSLTGLSSLNMAVATPEGHSFELESFVSDLRYEESVATAASLKAQGVPIAEISGDLTDLWIKQYSRQWKQKPMSLAGVTGKDALFVLETLAPDYGMRLIYRAEIPQNETSSTQEGVELISWIIVPRQIAEELS
ncbi:MAG: hypothetical protein ACI934_000680 [Pseudohongiellaceae bacterium]|jgi:hypothetical protein